MAYEPRGAEQVMWRDFVSESDGTVKIDGVPLLGADGASAYAAAIEAFATEARSTGTPVLVRSTGEGGHSWFSVAPDGSVAVAQPRAEGDNPSPKPTAAAAPTAPVQETVLAVPTEPGLMASSGSGGEALRTRRKPSAADFGANVAEPAPHPAQLGLRGFLNTMGFRFAPGAAELEERRWRATTQKGVAGHKTVVFVNLKGGATKTTATFMVGATLGRVRGGNLLDWDNNENQGTLGDLAAPASHDLTARDLLDNIDRFAIPSNSSELTNYIRPQGENRFHVLASQDKASNTVPIDGEDFVQLHRMLQPFYHLILVDTGNAATASTWQAAVEIADEIVLVALNKADSTKKLAATVDTLVAQGLEAKLARGVLLLTEPTAPPKKGSDREKESSLSRSQAIEHFGHYVREIVHIPYDEALADGKQIVYENLQPAAQRAYLAATAAIVAGL